MSGDNFQFFLQHFKIRSPQKLNKKLLTQSLKNLPKSHKFNFQIIHLLNGSYSKPFSRLVYFRKIRLWCVGVGHSLTPPFSSRNWKRRHSCWRLLGWYEVERSDDDRCQGSPAPTQLEQERQDPEPEWMRRPSTRHTFLQRKKLCRIINRKQYEKKQVKRTRNEQKKGDTKSAEVFFL